MSVEFGQPATDRLPGHAGLHNFHYYISNSLVVLLLFYVKRMPMKHRGIPAHGDGVRGAKDTIVVQDYGPFRDRQPADEGVARRHGQKAVSRLGEAARSADATGDRGGRIADNRKGSVVRTESNWVI